MSTIEARRQGHVRGLRAAYAVLAGVALAHGAVALVERWRLLRTMRDGADLVWSSSGTVLPTLVAVAAVVVVLATVLAARALRPGYVVATAALLVPLGAVSPAGPWEPVMPGILAYSPTAHGSDLSPDPFLLAAVVDSVTVVGALALLALVGRPVDATPDVPEGVPGMIGAWLPTTWCSVPATRASTATAC